MVKTCYHVNLQYECKIQFILNVCVCYLDGFATFAVAVQHGRVIE